MPFFLCLLRLFCLLMSALHCFSAGMDASAQGTVHGEVQGAGVGPQPGWVDEVREAACLGQIHDPTTGERGNIRLHFLAGDMWIRTDPASAGHSKGYGYPR